MKRLLFVISQLYKGGAEISLVNLLNHLDYAKYNVDLLILNQKPVENAVSLVKEINEEVHVCDAYENYGKIKIWDRIRAKFIYTMEQKGAFYFPALDFVKNKMYDWAFFVGEWCSPSFVAYHVNAKHKAAWIHTDIAAADYFDGEEYFFFDDCIEKYIFVSTNSQNSALRKYHFLNGKSEVIYNMVNTKLILDKSREQTEGLELADQLPVIVTCANIRDEKNHLRQVKVMADLKRKGVDFYWINIGSVSNKILVQKIQKLCKQEKLEDRFLLLGAKDNPYPYMKKAVAVAVLSDFESWSMVITEAKTLGIPVIATRTSGALEQIEDGVTGVLTDFDEIEIVEKLGCLLKDKGLQQKIRENLKNFDITKNVIESFDKLLEQEKTPEKDILYFIDDINYQSGAREVTFQQIRALQKQGRKIDIFSNTIPDYRIRNRLEGVCFLSWMNCPANRLFIRRFLDCILDRSLSEKEKALKRAMHRAQAKRSAKTFEEYVLSSLTGLCSQYNVTIVMSEGSAFRRVVADSSCKNKVQWIHTDYCKWREFSEWTLELTKDDGELYSNFNCIVVLSEKIKRDFLGLYPFLEGKVEVIKNIIPVEEIVKNSERLKKNYPKVHFITVGRLSQEKAFERLVEILSNIKNQGYDFLWEIVGDGPDKDKIQGMIENLDLRENVKLLGWRKNPYPLMKKAQIFSLLSVYEGMPNTIYEALILGIPVLATDVGGIREQIKEGVNGWVVANDKQKIEEKICYLIEHQEEIETAKENAEKYCYKNNEIIKKLNQILG